jgi:hypothetical protein
MITVLYILGPTEKGTLVFADPGGIVRSNLNIEIREQCDRSIIQNNVLELLSGELQGLCGLIFSRTVKVSPYISNPII